MEIGKQYRQIHERYANKDIDRRTFVRSVGLMAAAAGLVGSTSALFSRYAHATQQIQFDAFGGVSQASFRKHVFQPFTAKTGIKVAEGSYRNAEEILTRVMADDPGTHNFVWTSTMIPYRIRRLDLGVEIDESRVPRMRDLVQKFVDYHREVFGGGKMTSIPNCLGGATMAYNPQKVDKAEIDAKGYQLLLDPKFKAGLIGDQGYTTRIWVAALQTKQDPNNIKDLEAIWGAIRRSKSAVLKYTAASAEVIKMWSSGEAFVGDVWYSPYNALRQGGYPIAQYNAPAGMYMNPGGVIALKGSPMDAFYEMMDILLSPPVMIAWAIEAGQMTLLDPTKHPFPKELQEIPGYDPTGKMQDYTAYDARYWAENADRFSREYRRVMVSG